MGMCSQRWAVLSKPRTIKGAWTSEEDTKLRALVAQHGSEKWVRQHDRALSHLHRQLTAPYGHRLSSRRKCARGQGSNVANGGTTTSTRPVGGIPRLMWAVSDTLTGRSHVRSQEECMDSGGGRHHSRLACSNRPKVGRDGQVSPGPA